MMSSDVPMPPARSIGRLLNASASATNALANDMLAEHGLTLAQWVLMTALWRKDGLLIGDLATYADKLLPAVSRLIDRMDEAGLVERRPDAEDRRAVRVFLTRKGKSLSHIRDFYLQVNSRLLDTFSEAEKETLFALLERLHANARTGR